MLTLYADRRDWLNGKRYHQRAELYFYKGVRHADIDYSGKQFSIPRVDVSHIGGKGSPAFRVSNMRIALDAFSLAVFFEQHFDAAVYHVAQILRAKEIGQYSHAAMWFDYLANNSPDDNWKYLSADANDSIKYTKFSTLFDYLVKIDRVVVKKSSQQILELLDNKLNSDELLRTQKVYKAYENNFIAAADYLNWVVDNKQSHVRHANSIGIFDRYLQLSIQSQKSKAAKDLINRLMAVINTRYPLIAPHFVMSVKGDITSINRQQIDLLDKVVTGKVKVLSKELLFVQLRAKIGSLRGKKKTMEVFKRLRNTITQSPSIDAQQVIQPMVDNTSQKTNDLSRATQKIADDTAINRIKVSMNQFVSVMGKDTDFGSSASVFNNNLVVGQIYEKNKKWHNMNPGAVRIYHINNNTSKEMVTLWGRKPSDFRYDNDKFGYSVEMKGKYIVVGAPYDDDISALTKENFNKSRLTGKYKPRLLIEQLFEKGYLDVNKHVTTLLNVRKNSTDERYNPIFNRDFANLEKLERWELLKILYESANTQDTGSIYIFHKSKNEWQLETQITASDASKGARFGMDISMDGNNVLVCAGGAYKGNLMMSVWANTFGGGAYIISKQNGQWVENSKLTEYKCHAVALWKDWAMVAVLDPASGRGAVHAYRNINGVWQMHQTLSASDFTKKGEAFLTYGSSLDVADGVVAIGNRLDDRGDQSHGTYRGSVYLFKLFNGVWRQTQIILPPTFVGRSSSFGSSVAITGEYLAVGAPNQITGKFSQPGGVYLYKQVNNRWQMIKQYSAPTKLTHPIFGKSIAIQNGKIAVSAPREGNGKVYFSNIQDH